MGIAWRGCVASMIVLVSHASAQPAKLAGTFAPEVVGTPVVASAPIAGDYAVAVSVDRLAFASTELSFEDHITGAMQLKLATDGTVTACLASRVRHESLGQMHYERDPAKRKHSKTEFTNVLGLAGAWKVADGIATIRFDRSSWTSCDAKLATVSPDPTVELACVGIAATDRVPVRALACEATQKSQLLELGMPMTKATLAPTRPGARLLGHQLILGAPGLRAELKHVRVPTPAITFRAETVTLVEKDYRATK